MDAPLCCDTSFLMSLYTQDAHTERALAEAHGHTQPITVTALNEYEFLNAVQLTVFRRIFTLANAALVEAAFEDDLAVGKLALTPCNLAAVVREAGRLSGAHTPQGGYRSFDILHVAAARALGAAEFLSFDDKQRTLATAIGLHVRP